MASQAPARGQNDPVACGETASAVTGWLRLQISNYQGRSTHHGHDE